MRHTRRATTAALTRLPITLAAIGTMVSTAYAQQSPAPGSPAPLPPPPAYSAPPPPVLTAPPSLAPPPLPPPLAPTIAASPPPTLSASGLTLPTSGLQLIAYPYLWLAGLNMAITTPLARAPQVNVSIGPGEILSDLNNAPFMGAAELRYGPFGVLADALHIPLGVPITTRNIFFSGGTSGVVASIVTGDFLYRVLDQPVQTIDGGLGFRWWGISADTILNGRPPLPTVSVSSLGSWTDPLIAARYHREFGNGFGLTAYGDVGGFGIAAHVD